MRIGLQGYALQHRSVITSQLNVSTSLRILRNIRQNSTVNDEINSNNTMNMDPSITETQGTSREDSNLTTRPPPPRPRSDRKPKPPKEPPPDHFLAIRLSHDSSVTSTITSIHDSILQYSPHLQPACVDPMSAHLTLGVLHLPTEEKLNAAQAALLTAAKAAALQTPCSVTLQSIGHFRNQVVFLELAKEEEKNEKKESHRVLEVATAVRQHFQEQGLLLQAERAFVPHVTVAKLSKMQPWRGNTVKSSSRWGGRGRGRGKGRWKSQQQHHQEEREEIEQDDRQDKEEEAIVDIDPAPNNLDSSSNSRDDSNATIRKKHENEKQREGEHDLENKKIVIPVEAYESLSSISTDAVEVHEIQLCAMQGRKPGEYYTVIASASLIVTEAGAGVEIKRKEEQELN